MLYCRSFASSLALFGVPLLLSLAAKEAHAQAARLNYQQNKTLQVTPPGAPAGNPSVTVTHYEHAWYFNTNQLIPLDASAAVSPNPQSDANYNLFAYDWKDINAKKRTIVNVGVIPDAKGNFPKNPAPAIVDENSANVNAALNNVAFQVKATPLNDNADAQVTFQTVPVPAANAAYLAKFSVDGSVTKQPGVIGYAFSEATVQYKDIAAVLKNTRVNQNPSSNIGRVGSGIPQQSRTFDPLSFTLLDSSGNALFTDNIVSTLTAANDDGEVDWSDTGSISLLTGSEGLAGVHIAINPLYVLSGESGTLDFEITNGIVDQSSATGIFAGISLPSVNTVLSSFTFNIGSGGLTTDLALDSVIAANPGTTSIELDSDEGGLILAGAAAPEPGTLPMVALGMIVASGGIVRRRRQVRAH